MVVLGHDDLLVQHGVPRYLKPPIPEVVIVVGAVALVVHQWPGVEDMPLQDKGNVGFGGPIECIVLLLAGPEARFQYLIQILGVAIDFGLGLGPERDYIATLVPAQIVEPLVILGCFFQELAGREGRGWLFRVVLSTARRHNIHLHGGETVVGLGYGILRREDVVVVIVSARVGLLSRLVVLVQLQGWDSGRLVRGLLDPVVFGVALVLALVEAGLHLVLVVPGLDDWRRSLRWLIEEVLRLSLQFLLLVDVCGRVLVPARSSQVLGLPVVEVGEGPQLVDLLSVQVLQFHGLHFLLLVEHHLHQLDLLVLEGQHELLELAGDSSSTGGVLHVLYVAGMLPVHVEGDLVSGCEVTARAEGAEVGLDAALR